MMQKMPTGPYILRRAEKDFAKEPMAKFGYLAFEYLSWIGRNREVRHKFNDYEARIGDRCIPVDGLSGRNIYQFHGCR